MHMWIALKITWSSTNIRRIVEYDSSNYKLLKRGVRFAPYSTNIRRIEHVRKFDRSPIIQILTPSQFSIASAEPVNPTSRSYVQAPQDE
jgi:hypothetical protein